MMKSFEDLISDLEDMKEASSRIKSFNPNSVNSRWSDPNIIRLNTYLQAVFDRVFAGRDAEQKNYSDGKSLSSGSYTFHELSIYEIRQDIANSKDAVIAIWDSAIEQRELEISRYKEKKLKKQISNNGELISNKIFIVHGHDKAPRHEIENLLQKQSLKPIILELQASGSKTVIEKFEEHGEVGFAIVLLTGDDEGRKKGESQYEVRARQNVYFELGFFIGKLGRNRVCALRDNDVLVPSDLSGIIIEEFDSKGAWRTNLLKELRAAGYSIDMNHL